MQKSALKALFCYLRYIRFEPAAGSSRQNCWEQFCTTRSVARRASLRMRRVAKRDNGAACGDGPEGERNESSCTTRQCKNGAGGAFFSYLRLQSRHRPSSCYPPLTINSPAPQSASPARASPAVGHRRYTNLRVCVLPADETPPPATSFAHSYQR